MSANAAAAMQPGQRLGRYELLGEIASGGMATVYLGRAVGAKGFARLVAIKRLHPHLESEEDFVSMFLDEARLAARIRHPNCVPTLDVEDQEGLYLVMEYVEGDRLLGLLKYAARRGERIPLGIAMRIAVEACAGLHAAHELLDDDGTALNLVHRDISPQNVLVGIDGVTKITDFGIAKAESRLTQTREGQLKGKIAYMAPEQTRRASNQIDRRVDIFAMGIIVWEMLTGRRLFRGESDVEILNALVNEPIPTIRGYVPEIPDDLEAVVMKALEREPEDRYSTCAEFGEAIEQVSATFGGLAPTRVVAQYVQQVAGPKLEEERRRLKAGFGIDDPAGSSPQAPKRNTRITGELPVVNAAPPASMVAGPRSPSTPNLGGSMATPVAASMLAPPRETGGNRLVFVASLISVAALASGAAFWFASRQPANVSATGRPTTSADPSATAVVTAAPATALPSAVVTAVPSMIATAMPGPTVVPSVPTMMPMAMPTAMMLPNGQVVMMQPGMMPTAMATGMPGIVPTAAPPSNSGGGRRPHSSSNRPQQAGGAATPSAVPDRPQQPAHPAGGGGDDDDVINNPYRH